MSLSANLKMRLTKINKRIKVEYNTFEKAAFDEYLLSCLALECKSKKKIYEYIDDVTGDGSLNAHLKKLYDNEIAVLDKEQLQRVMDGSMFPIRCKNEKNTYDFYPQLGISVIYGMVIDGDIVERDDINDLIKMLDNDIGGDIVSITSEEREPVDKPDAYDVVICDDGAVMLKKGNRNIPIDRELFSKVVVNEAAEYIGLYEGEVYNHAVGDGWRALGAAYLKSIRNGDGIRSFYLDGKDYCVVRQNDVKITEVAYISGLHVYRERTVRLGTNPDLDGIILDKLCECGGVCRLKTDVLVAILEHVDEITAVRAINSVGMENNMAVKTAELAVSLMRRGLYDGWRVPVLKSVLEHCDKNRYTDVYRAGGASVFTVQQLLDVDSRYLSRADTRRVNKFYADMQAMKDEIVRIIGKITASGLRERSKELPNDREVNKFKQFCNSYIGHENQSIEMFNFELLEKRLEKMREFEKLAAVIKEKLEKLKSGKLAAENTETDK